MLSLLKHGYRWLVISLTVLLSACVEQPVYEAPDELSRVSAVAVSSPGFSLEPGASIAWRRDILWLRSDQFASAANPVNRINLQATLNQQFQQLGYRIDPVNTPSDYVLIAAIVLGDSDKGRDFEELARLYPSLEYISENLETGTLMVGLSRPGSPVILWRAGIQAFIAEDLAMDKRQQRLESIIRSLLRTLPLKGAEQG
ncbi:hypothetical protein [Oceanicoccus sagamiensis]|uniref:DUF4136 domain-containing protein n=1 Tax=Oceanicoccus sagamiensis TaxID=716816 RepID=A0A1X9NFN6_9GAMM|nr:hypothetical protein [Oceanicoccus sagamiensis]ARN75991.1 hypothetical protein BST96_18965 [Oceanicoccus sagamiensis]